MRFLLGRFVLHWAEPLHRTEIRNWTTSLGYKPKDKPSVLKHRFVSHEIAAWYGLSFGDKWFLGFMRFEKTTQTDSLELPSYVSREERKRYADYDNWPLAESCDEKDPDADS